MPTTKKKTVHHKKIVPLADPAPIAGHVHEKRRTPKWLARPAFARVYLLSAAIVLVTTTAFWALLGANLHQSNADQLVDPYLLSFWTIFHGATFPGAHTFLFKWPLFVLMDVFGLSPLTLSIFTAAVVLVTVGALAWLMYRIERRPLVIGTLFLALAACLLLVPTQPYAGGILPVNMAMLTTRNLEYVLYIAGLALLIRAPRFKSRQFVIATLLLGVLIASDKLFLSLSVGGALLALVAYAFAQNWRLVTLSARWLAASALAGVIAIGLLMVINLSGLTHIANQSGASPYGLVQGTKSGIVAVVYAVMGFFTNFGANPAFDATQVAQIPSHLFHRLLSLGGPAYLINLVIVLIGLLAVGRIMLLSLVHKKTRTVAADNPYALALMLIWSTVAAAAVFIVSNHYYAVDARYLTIGVFAVFVSVAVVVRKRKWRPEWIVGSGLVLLVALLCGIVGAIQTHQHSRAALQPIDERNQVLAQVLARHHVDVLVGDYWRVLPIKLDARSHVRIAPLGSCTSFRGGLTSRRWFPDLHKHSFTYLISFDKSLTDFPSCSLKQVTDAYGDPNNTVLIAGDIKRPSELLLFYDRGIQPKRAKAPEVVSTIAPIQLNQLPNTTCEGPTTLTVVAHQDDDLLFINPDLEHDIAAGHCMRTVYLTAGDGGNDKFYWLGREQGSEAAYDSMTGNTQPWAEQTVQLPDKQYVMVASPTANSKVSLIFVHLPDGNLTGKGFAVSHYESLQRLHDGMIPFIHSVDGQSSYSAQDLTEGLEAIMHTYQPTQIRTQATVMGHHITDHSDHMATSNFVQAAYTLYEKARYENQVTIPLTHYIGYPIRELPANVSPDDLARKQEAFFAYARFDGAVCFSIRDCSHTPTYWEYLARQYTAQ